MSTIDVKIPALGDYKDVPVIDVLVKPGDAVSANDAQVLQAPGDTPNDLEGFDVADLLESVRNDGAEGGFVAEPIHRIQEEFCQGAGRDRCPVGQVVAGPQIALLLRNSKTGSGKSPDTDRKQNPVASLYEAGLDLEFDVLPESVKHTAEGISGESHGPVDFALVLLLRPLQVVDQFKSYKPLGVDLSPLALHRHTQAGHRYARLLEDHLHVHGHTTGDGEKQRVHRPRSRDVPHVHEDGGTIVVSSGEFHPGPGPSEPDFFIRNRSRLGCHR